MLRITMHIFFSTINKTLYFFQLKNYSYNKLTKIATQFNNDSIQREKLNKLLIFKVFTQRTVVLFFIRINPLTT